MAENGNQDPLAQGNGSESPPASEPDRQQAPDFMPPPPPPDVHGRQSITRTVKKMEAVVLKTTLDLDQCRRIAQDTTPQKNAILKEMVKSAPSDAFQPKKLIDKYRKAAPCSASWDDMSGKGLFKVCHKCTLHVYDFANSELSEAEELVLKRENKWNPVFYRRKDGKFLTMNCPEGVRRRQKLIALAAAVFCLFAMAATSFILSPPPPPPPAVSASAPPPPLDITQRRYQPDVKKNSVAARTTHATSPRFLDMMMSGYQSAPSQLVPTVMAPSQIMMPVAPNAAQSPAGGAALGSSAPSTSSAASGAGQGTQAQPASPYVQYYK